VPDDGHLIDRFRAWVPDAEIRERILVDNPGKLYGFDA
jgi:predicted TIM-barrel fold metal-dependent hydrolase